MAYKKYHMVFVCVNRLTNSRHREHGSDSDTNKVNIKERNYIQETLRSVFNDAGFSYWVDKLMDVSVFDSGSTDLSYLDFIKKEFPFIKIHKSKERITLCENSNRAFKYGAERAEHVIYIQDDVKVTENLGYILDKRYNTVPTDFSFCSLFWNRGSGEAWQKVPRKSFYGSLFMMAKSSTVEEMLGWFEQTKQRLQGSGHDLGIRDYADKYNKPIYQWGNPLVSHLGNFSSLGDRPIRGIHPLTPILGSPDDLYFCKQTSVLYIAPPTLEKTLRSLSYIEKIRKDRETKLDLFYDPYLDKEPVAYSKSIFKMIDGFRTCWLISHLASYYDVILAPEEDWNDQHPLYKKYKKGVVTYNINKELTLGTGVTLKSGKQTSLLECVPPVGEKVLSWAYLKKMQPNIIWQELSNVDVIQVTEHDDCWDWVKYLCEIYNCEIRYS